MTALAASEEHNDTLRALKAPPQGSRKFAELILDDRGDGGGAMIELFIGLGLVVALVHWFEYRQRKATETAAPHQAERGQAMQR